MKTMFEEYAAEAYLTPEEMFCVKTAWVWFLQKLTENVDGSCGVQCCVPMETIREEIGNLVDA